ncbi:ATPase wrnip1 [Trifolium pratense]|uniref:ATPase wrnip1 n=1 Tax=Trifolium pratense TaxID=57577 RepID=A0A2K3N4Q6_TRIPR|nr:ATPase wrnip1 [Trifolium pratense]PNY08196.1 ATPase wrnip1 [Trifolium pratense]
MEMQQLLSMGFPDELAAQALAATGGKSTVKATEWILTHKPNSTTVVNPSPSSLAFQPKLDRFFNVSQQEQTEEPNKRIKLSSSPTPQPQTQQQNKPSFFFNRSKKQQSQTHTHEPLYERLRPTTLDDVVGQDHLLSTNSILRSAIQRNRLPSILLWGPPGTGKTTIAKAIINSSNSTSTFYRFVSLSAVTSGVKDVRDAVDEARKLRLKTNQTTVLFVDEVHRFNKSQQDSFLPVIEDGSIVFVGATTENPSFHLITPLLSRCRVLTLNPLQSHHLVLLLNRAVTDIDKGLVQSLGFGSGSGSSQVDVSVGDDVVDFIANNCDGDARVALNVLEIAAVNAAARVQHDNEECKDDVGVNVSVSVEDAKEALQCKHLAYDKAGEEHYNLISALHKSMRGSDADAAIYWLARMLKGGEEPLYIARRLVRFASEDVGLADPLALNQAVSCYQACHFIGMPECNVILAQCVAYLALAPKSIAVYRAIGAAEKLVRESVGQNEGVPLHLRNAPTKLMKEIGYGKGYIYTPDNPSSTQSYLPPSLQGFKFLHWPDRNPSESDG